MLTEAKAARILAAEKIPAENHSLSKERLEAARAGLGSPTPVDRFNPTRFKGLEALQVAVQNLQTQRKIGEIIPIIDGRKEAADRTEIVRNIGDEVEEKVFDIFNASDLSHVLYIYYKLHSRIDRWLEGGVVDARKVQALGWAMYDRLPLEADYSEPSPSVLRQKNDAAIDKTQKWLDDPKMHERMEQLIPESNDKNEEDVWDFMDSLVALNRKFGERGMNVKMFIEQYSDKFSGKGFPVDIRKPEWTNVVMDGSGAIELSDQIPTVIYSTSDLEAGHQSGASYVKQEIAPKPKAVEQRKPDIRERLGESLDDIMSRQEFSTPVTGMAVNRTYQGLKRSILANLLEKNYISVPVDRDNHQRFDAAAIATIMYLSGEGAQLPPQLKKQVQGIAIEEFNKKIQEQRKDS